ncbi:MAG TPA: potassium channel family protein [Lachnospiraceae bacterium]|jgi:voltage-gated potassium channel|nr:potassium channel family protein [Lachnospiraceae bacterium]
MRRRLYEIVHNTNRKDKPGYIYTIIIVTASITSILPICFKVQPFWMPRVELYSVYILFFDYVFRWMTYDYACGKSAPKAFLLYPLMPLTILNFISLLPTLGILGSQFLVLRLFRVTTIAHYSKSMTYIANVFRKEKDTLLSVLYIAIAYIFVSALVMFACEPQSFDDFFEALYWATTALTTVGYGDVSPVTVIGRLVSMVSSLFGIAVIALPAGIVTAGFVQEIDAAKAAKNAEILADKQQHQVYQEDELTDSQSQENRQPACKPQENGYADSKPQENEYADSKSQENGYADSKSQEDEQTASKSQKNERTAGGVQEVKGDD